MNEPHDMGSTSAWPTAAQARGEWQSARFDMTHAVMVRRRRLGRRLELEALQQQSRHQ